MDQLNVLLIISSPVMRACLRASLRQIAGVVVAGEAASAAQGIRMTLAQHPAVMLCDLSALTEPAMPALAGHLFEVRIVLVTGVENPVLALGSVRIAGQFPFNLHPEQLKIILQSIVAAPVQCRQPALPPARTQALAAEPSQRGQIATPDGPLPIAPTVRPPMRASGSGFTPSKRRLGVRLARLNGVLHAVQENRRQHPHDPETGLAGVSALEQAIALLPGVQQEAAFMLVELQDAARLQPGVRLINRMPLRQLSSALCASVRVDDLVCRVGQATWAAILPGMTPQAAPALLERLRVAVAPLFSASSESEEVTTAIGIDFWLAESTATEVLAHCVRAVRGMPPVQTLRRPEPIAVAWRWPLA